jgi:cytochrome c peroxidase
MKIRQQWQTQKGVWAAIAIFPIVVISFAKNDQRSRAPTHSETVRQIKAERVSERSVEPIRPLIKQTDLNQEKVQLGKMLFHETSLSADGSLSCASCHDVGNGGVDGLETSIAINHQIGPINSPTVLNSVFNANFFWDGRSISLVDQIAGPIHNTLEMGSDWKEVIQKISRKPALVEVFKQLCGTTINAENIADAIAEYERDLVTPGAPFDLYLQGDPNAISNQAKHGYQVFKEVGCIACHQGTNVGSNAFQPFGVLGNYFADRGNITAADYGQFNFTGREQDKHRFKVPTLRNIELTAPCLHDGKAAQLNDAVRIMARYQLGLELSDQEVDDIVEFLRSLTGRLPEELR